MKTILNLTELEKLTLKELAESMYAEYGFSDCGFSDLSSQLNISTKILRGVVGSLVKKGLVMVENDNGWEKVDIIYLINDAEGLVSHWVEENKGELEAAEII